MASIWSPLPAEPTNVLSASCVARVLVHAAEEVGANRKQSIRSSIYAAAKRLYGEYDTDYAQIVRASHSLILALYGGEIHGSFVYNGGYGSGFWLTPSQKAQMQDALLFAYEYCVTDMGAEREAFFEDSLPDLAYP